MFIKADGFTLVTGAPTWLSSPIWSYVPLVLVSIYVAIAIYRLLHPMAVQEPVIPWPEPLPSPGPPPLRSPSGGREAKAKERPFIIHTMDMARQSAGMPYNRNPREAEKEWPTMHAALLSAKKEFDIPMPPILGKTLLDLECGKRFLEQILPLLRAGHDDEARKAAEAFNERLKSQ